MSGGTLYARRSVLKVTTEKQAIASILNSNLQGQSDDCIAVNNLPISIYPNHRGLELSRIVVIIFASMHDVHMLTYVYVYVIRKYILYTASYIV